MAKSLFMSELLGETAPWSSVRTSLRAPPLVLVVSRSLASSAGADLLAIPLAAGGARLLYRAAAVPLAPLLPALQRSVLADLTLPLERHRLAALVQSLGERARVTGRSLRHTPPDTRV